MHKYLLLALDQAPLSYRKDSMFDRLERELKRDPAMIIIDEIDAVAGSRGLISLLKAVHDVTGSAILMVGEERVDALLRRYESFYNRLNLSAFVQVGSHSLEDITRVVAERCDYQVDASVCEEIFKSRGKSIRSVVLTILEMERFCRSNGVKRVGMSEFTVITGGKAHLRAVPKPPAGETQPAMSPEDVAP